MLADWCESRTHCVSMATVTPLIEYQRQYPRKGSLNEYFPLQRATMLGSMLAFWRAVANILIRAMLDWH